MPVIDSYSESNRDGYISLGNASALKSGGQSFLGANQIIDTVQFYLARASYTGTATAVLYAHSGIFGTNSVPTGNPLATSDAVSLATLSADPIYTLVTFPFSGANRVTLASITQYCISLSAAVSGAGREVRIGTDGSTPTHAGNAYRQTTIGDYAALATQDVIFYVNGVAAAAAAQQNSGFFQLLQ